MSVTSFSATHTPAKRDSARPARPRSYTSCTLPAASTGMPAAISANSLCCGTVEEWHTGSSPTAISTPPRGAVPARFAWCSASPLRSTPGPLPYHIAYTPS